MALINNYWVHVKTEDWDNQVQSTSHPVEKGLAITDTIRKEPRTLSITGLIVDAGGKTSTAIVNALKDLMNAGSLIEYNGVKTASNMQIQSFKYSHSNEVWGGCEFDMELKEVRIAKKAYVPTSSDTSANTGGTTIKVGSIVVFKGGSVYVSSDAKKAAATRGRSTCKCTIINTRSWAKHPYHLISTDGKKVYGWVDTANIEGASNPTSGGAGGVNTNSKTDGGTQQTQRHEGLDAKVEEWQQKIDNAKYVLLSPAGSLWFTWSMSPEEYRKQGRLTIHNAYSGTRNGSYILFQDDLVIDATKAVHVANTNKWIIREGTGLARMVIITK